VSLLRLTACDDVCDFRLAPPRPVFVLALPAKRRGGTPLISTCVCGRELLVGVGSNDPSASVCSKKETGPETARRGGVRSLRARETQSRGNSPDLEIGWVYFRGPPRGGVLVVPSESAGLCTPLCTGDGRARGIRVVPPGDRFVGDGEPPGGPVGRNAAGSA
jgi:hypothetical protein